MVTVDAACCSLAISKNRSAAGSCPATSKSSSPTRCTPFVGISSRTLCESVASVASDRPMACSHYERWVWTQVAGGGLCRGVSSHTGNTPIHSDVQHTLEVLRLQVRSTT